MNKFVLVALIPCLLVACAAPPALGPRPSAASVKGHIVATNASLRASRAALKNSQDSAARGAAHLDSVDSNLSLLLATPTPTPK